MAFEARVYIQGVGVYVPHRNQGELVVLFPSSKKAEEGNYRYRGKAFRRHHAIVQYRSGFQNREASLRDWLTHTIEDCWISFAAEGAHKLELSDLAFRGLPALDTILRKPLPAGPRVKESLPGGAGMARKLVAGLYINAGKLSPAEEYEAKFEFKEAVEDRAARDQRELARGLELSSVIKVELGEVESFALCRQPWDRRKKPDSIVFDNRFDELEVWVRHFDDMRPPDPDAPCPEEARENEMEDPDVDFALNYWTLDNLKDLEGFPVPAPVPKVVLSWASGGPVGGCAHKCMGCKFQVADFGAPIDLDQARTKQAIWPRPQD